MSLVGFQAKNHPQQQATDEVDDRAITMADFEPLHERFGFTIDAAAAAHNARLPRFWTRQDDALGKSWVGERVWCNPPYSEIGRWVAKAWRQHAAGCELIVMLLPANRTEQGWWQDMIEPFRLGRVETNRMHVEFLRGRMRFERPNAVVGPKGDRPPFGCCLVIWGEQ